MVGPNACMRVRGCRVGRIRGWAESATGMLWIDFWRFCVPKGGSDRQRANEGWLL